MSLLAKARATHLRGYVFVDYATQGYLALVGLLVLLFHGGQVPGWLWLVGGHLICMLLVHGLIGAADRPGAGRVLQFLRHFYPILLYTGLYRETGFLDGMFVAACQDPFFIRLEEALFGCQPSLVLMDRMPWAVVSEVFYAAYFSYYIMIVGVGVALFIRDGRAFFHYVSVVSFVFYACYLIYIFLPVMGPRIFYVGAESPPVAGALPAVDVPEYPAAVQSGFLFQMMACIYRVFESPGAAFPSSHVAVAYATVWFSFHYLRRIRWVHFTVAALLSVATVYCRYHYVVDVMAGLAAGSLLVWFGDRMYRRGVAKHLPRLRVGPPNGGIPPA